MSGEERRAGTPSIVVAGPEGSGTTLLWRCITAHPELAGMRSLNAPHGGLPLPDRDLILHLSFPTLRPMVWLQPEDLPAGAKVILLRRSTVHTVYSAYRRFHTDPAEALRSYFRAVELERRYVASCAPLCICYEDLVSRPAEVLRSVYEYLGVSGRFRPSIQLRDRNDERWRDDSEFVRSVRGAFGPMEAGEFADRAGQRHKRIAAGGEEPRSAAPTGAASEGRDGVRYLCIENFLPPVEHARTLDLFADDDEAFDRAELRGMFERHLRRVLPHVRRELGLAWFPFGSIEHRVSAAQGGAPFAAQFDGDRDILANCPLICLYRFHRQSKRFSGGDLRIWADETGEAGRGRRSGHVDVDLPDNAAVLFPGDLRWQMGPIDYESTAPDARCFSISLWFRRGQIPESLAQRRAGERLGLFGSGSQGQRDSS